MARFLSLLLCLTAFLTFLAGSAAHPKGTTNDKPAIILIPAAFSKAAVYNDVKGRLTNLGYDVVSIDLPSVGKRAALVDRAPDIKEVQKNIGRMLHQGKNIILVGNSYGATVICDAVKDFEDKSFIKADAHQHGKIMGMIFFSGFLPYISELTGARPDIRQISPPWFRFEGTSRVYWDNGASLPPSVTLFNALPNDQVSTWASKLEPSSFKALNATTQYIPYDGKFRALYVIGARDFAVPPAFAQTYLAQPGAKFESVTIDSDHMPMLSKPDEFVKVVRKFAGESV